MNTIDISPRQIAEAIEDLLDKNELLQDKVYKLEDRINKATEYIEQLEQNEWEKFGRTILLEILKGDNNE